MKSVRWDSEAGQGHVDVLIGVAVIAGLALIGLFGYAVKESYDWLHAPPRQGPPAATSIPFIGPGLPSDATQRACVLEKAGLVHLQYGAKGWEAPEIYPKPDPGASQAIWNDWEAKIRSYYGSRQDEWAKCLVSQSAPAAPPQAPPEPTLAWPGSYALSFGSGASCTGIPVQGLTLTASGTPDALTLVVHAVGGSATTTGTMGTTYSFSTNGVPGSENVFSGARLLGQFDTDGQNIVIRNGSMALNYPDSNGAMLSCSLPFTGLKHG